MSWDWSWHDIIFSIVTVGLALAVCWLSWKRSDFSWKSAFLEGLRFTLVVLVIVTLMQPEYILRETPKTQGTVVVLHDTSGSMKTRDVMSEGQYKSRAETLAPWITRERWNQLANDLEVIIEPFDSTRHGEKGTDIHEALDRLIDRYPHLQSIVLASDGDWNDGANPIGAARRLRSRGVPVYSLGVGSEQRLPDLSLTGLEVPSFAVVGKPLRIPYSVSSSIAQDIDIVVDLQLQGATVSKETVRVPAMGVGKGTFEWRPSRVGEEILSVKIANDSRDLVPTNNERTIPLSLRNESLKVLLIESYPRWEYRYLRNALERDPGIEVSCYLQHPELKHVGGGRGYLDQFPDEQSLFGFDVVFVGDIGVGPNELAIEQCERLKRLVQTQAGGLVFMPGMRGRQSTLLQSPLEELFPVDMDLARPKGIGSSRPSQFQLTEAGHQSLLTRFETNEIRNEEIWRNLPGFYWFAAVDKARPGSQILATHDRETNRSGRIPLIATKTYGNGKVLFMGSDGAWRWRKGVEDKYHYRFWGQVVRWMSYQRTMSNGESMRLFHLPDRPQERDLITLQANVMNANGEPLQAGSVTTRVTAPNGKVEVIALSRDDPDAWGLFRGEFKPEMGGEYKLLTTCRETGKSLNTTLFIEGLEREQIGSPARFEVLRDVSQSTRGQFVTLDQAEQIVEMASARRQVEPTQRRIPLWSHPIWAATLLGLLGLFWIGRKAVGLL